MTSTTDTDIISPRLLGHMTGLLFLLTIMGGIFAQGIVSDSLVDPGNAAVTAKNILANRGLFQFSFTVFMIEMACQVATTVLFYRLLKPVNGTVALLMLFLEITACIVKTTARLFYLAPLFLLKRPEMLAGFSVEQVQSIALLLLRVNSWGTVPAVIFFGFSNVLSGYLVFRSTFLPRWLGVLSFIGGLGWLTFLYPSWGYRAFPVVVVIALVGAAAKIFWLLVFGVNAERWRAQAGLVTIKER